MKKITLQTTYSYWECECCGAGHHITVEVPELNIAFSEDDQFGGKLDDGHEEWPIKSGAYYTVEEIKEYYEQLGYEVMVDETFD